MRWWDESMFAVNTYEMINNGNYFSAYFDGLPDLFNTKPPLTSWIQIVFVKFLGYNELALRLPSAIAASLTVLLLFIFVFRNYNILLAWLSALVLLTSSGFIGFHTARTADSDSLLTLFLLLTNIYFFNFIKQGNKKYIFYFFLFISLAFATKMHAALLFTPAYLIVLIQEKKINQFVVNYFFTGGLLLFLSIGFGLIYLRELSAPGYINEVLFKDTTRIWNVVERHEASGTFYFDNFIRSRFSIWFVLFVIGVFLAYVSEDLKLKKLLVYLLTLILAYLLIITISITKLEWYDMPLYPYISVITAFSILLLIEKFILLSQQSSGQQITLVLIFIFAFPYYRMFEKSQGNSIHIDEKIAEANENYLFKRSQEKKNLGGIHVYFTGYKGSLLFYKYKLTELGQNIELVNDGNFAMNDKVLVSNDSLFASITKKYIFTTIDTYQHSKLLLIGSKIN